MIRQFAVITLILVLSLSSLGAAEELPRFSLPALKRRTVRSEELKDKIVVLDFWATWCAPCIGEVPGFNKLQEKYASRGVQIIGIAAQSGWASDIKRFASKHSMRYTILVGTDDTVSDFNVIAFPTTYVIAPGWKLYKKYSGTYEGKSAEIERDVEVLLKGN